MRPNTLTNTKTNDQKNQNSTKQTPPPNRAAHFASMLATTIQLPNTTPHHQDRATTPGVVSGPNSVPAIMLPSPKKAIVVVHPVPATTAQHPFTARPSPNARAFSWCSLER